MPKPTNRHYDIVLDALVEGELIPFLGAGANLCDRPDGVTWTRPQTEYLPDGEELAEYLAGRVHYPKAQHEDLPRISQYVALERGSGPLYRFLHRVFDADCPPTTLHRFLAELPKLVRDKGYPGYPLIVTTNYDDLMERAFQEAGQPYDVVSYVAKGKERGKFEHRPYGAPDGKPVLIEVPNRYRDFALDQRPVVLKFHGAIDRVEGVDRDNYVITEDHYIDYLTRTDASNLIPAPLLARLKSSGFLFLGYGLSDWNLRVILYRIWGEQELGWESWAVKRNPDSIETKFWSKRGVEIVEADLCEYVSRLDERAQALVPEESTL